MRFGEYILEEIEILNPKMIICCGLGIKNIIETIYKENHKLINRKIIEVPHPSYVIKGGDEKYQELFIRQLSEII